MIYLLHDSPITFVVHQEAILARLLLLPILEVCSHFERDLAFRTVCRVELAEIIEFARGDEEVVFGITCNDWLEVCQEGRLLERLTLAGIGVRDLVVRIGLFLEVLRPFDHKRSLVYKFQGRSQSVADLHGSCDISDLGELWVLGSHWLGLDTRSAVGKVRGCRYDRKIVWTRVKSVVQVNDVLKILNATTRERTTFIHPPYPTRVELKELLS
jgi:hypothetical protein